jgi:hypothetical protein
LNRNRYDGSHAEIKYDIPIDKVTGK